MHVCYFFSRQYPRPYFIIIRFTHTLSVAPDFDLFDQKLVLCIDIQQLILKTCWILNRITPHFYCMQVKYLNFRQAKALCSEFQYLKNRDTPENSPDPIWEITVAPYSKILQWQFVKNLVRGVPFQKAIQICVNGRFDVVIIYKNEKVPANPFSIKSLRSYLKEKAIPQSPNRLSLFRIHSQ